MLFVGMYFLEIPENKFLRMKNSSSNLRDIVSNK